MFYFWRLNIYFCFHVSKVPLRIRSRLARYLYTYIGFRPCFRARARARLRDGYARRETEGSETCKTGFPPLPLPPFLSSFSPCVMYTSKITGSLLLAAEISSQQLRANSCVTASSYFNRRSISLPVVSRRMCVYRRSFLCSDRTVSPKKTIKIFPKPSYQS